MLNFDVWFSKPGHWDCLLREKLSAHAGMRAELSAGYLYPCLGHYSQHESAVEKGVRETTWDMRHILQETRTSELAAGHHDSIAVCAFETSGPLIPLHNGIKLPDTPPDQDFRWWTAAITVAEPEAGKAPKARKRAAEASSVASTPDRWVPKGLYKRRKVTVTGRKDDWETPDDPIFTTFWQIFDETEGIPAQTTESLNRRWRAACNLFSHRSFTNDPAKVAAWRNLGR